MITIIAVMEKGEKMSDLISKQMVLRCIKESRDNIDWGQSEDGDAFLHYTGALYRTIASEECFPSAQPEIIRCKDCKFQGHIQRCPFGKRNMPHANGYCCYGERREDDKG